MQVLICIIITAIIITLATLFVLLNIRIIPFKPYTENSNAVEEILKDYEGIKILKGFLMKQDSNYLYADYIAIFPNGKVAVINECNIRGIIDGKMGDKYWISDFYTYKYLFQNPAKSNIDLIKTLQDISNKYGSYDKCNFVPMVVFPSISSRINKAPFAMSLKGFISNIQGIIMDKSNDLGRSERIETLIKAFDISNDTTEVQKYIISYNKISKVKLKKLFRNVKKLKI